MSFPGISTVNRAPLSSMGQPAEAPRQPGQHGLAELASLLAGPDQGGGGAGGGFNPMSMLSLLGAMKGGEPYTGPGNIGAGSYAMPGSSYVQGGLKGPGGTLGGGV